MHLHFETFQQTNVFCSPAAGRLWDIEDGRQLLRSMLQLGVALHGAATPKTKEAVTTFQEMMHLDEEDHLVSEVMLW